MAAAGAGGKGRGAPSVTLKLAMDRNGAVDDMAEGPKRFTSQESLDAGENSQGDQHAGMRVCGSARRSFRLPRWGVWPKYAPTTSSRRRCLS